MTVLAWMWEFLRRSPNYRLDWMDEVGPRFAADGSLYTPETRWAVGRYGLRMPLDPSKSTSDPPFAEPETPMYSGPGEYKVELRKGQYAFVIYGSIPISRQLEGIRRQLLQISETQVSDAPDIRVRQDKYTIYLRLLDGLAAGAKPKHISQKLYPNHSDYERRERFKAHQVEAEYMRDRGYLGIAMNEIRRGGK